MEEETSLNCPKCETGKLYEKKEETTGFKIRKCFACGYCWDDSPAYASNPELALHLFKTWFPQTEGWKASPAVGQPFISPEHWTEPNGCPNIVICAHMESRITAEGRSRKGNGVARSRFHQCAGDRKGSSIGANRRNRGFDGRDRRQYSI